MQIGKNNRVQEDGNDIIIKMDQYGNVAKYKRFKVTDPTPVCWTKEEMEAMIMSCPRERFRRGVECQS